MAVIYPSLVNSWYAAGGGASWTNSNSVYSGVSGGVNYRSCVQINVGAFTGTSNYLIVSFKCNGLSSVAGLYGVLSTNGNIATNCVVSDNYYGSYTNGPHASYLGSGASGYIAESDTYSDAACTALQGSYNQSSGYTCYLKFSSANIQPNTTYYLYLMRYIKSGDSTSSGWSTGYRTDMTATLTYTPLHYVEQRHYYQHVRDGWQYFNGDGHNVSHGNSFAPYSVTPPTGYYAGNNYGYYDWSNSAHLGSGTCGENSFTVDRQTYVHVHYYPNAYSYNFNILLPDGSEPWQTGEAGTVECSINGGAYSRIYNEAASSYAYDSTFHFRNFTPGAGMYLTNVTGATANSDGTWSATMGTSGLDINFYTAYYTYSISYNANGGSTTPGGQTKTYGTALTLRGAISRPDATKTITTTFNGNGGTPFVPTERSTATMHYEFTGWKATNGTVYAGGGSYTANEETTLTAQWRNSDWVGAAVSLPSADRPGYSFLGWYTAAVGGSKVTQYEPTANTTLYAHWSVNSHNITLYDPKRHIDIATYNDIEFGETITLPSPNSLPVLYQEYDSGWVDLVTDTPEGVMFVTSIAGPLSEKHIPSYYEDEYVGDSYTNLYTLDVDSDVTLNLCYRYDGLDIFECTIPEVSDFPNEPGMSVAYISKYMDDVPNFMPDKITPTSYIKIPFEHGLEHSGGYFGTYIINYQPEIGARTWIKQNGTYQLATTLVKDNASYSHNDGYLIKYDGRWMSIEEYLSIVQSGTSEAILDSGLLDSIILA